MDNDGSTSDFEEADLEETARLRYRAQSRHYLLTAFASEVYEFAQNHNFRTSELYKAMAQIERDQGRRAPSEKKTREEVALLLEECALKSEAPGEELP